MPEYDRAVRADWKAAVGKFEFAIVKWGERTYLIGRDRMRSFMSAVREGREPRRAGPGWGFLLELGGEQKAAPGEPQVPEWAKPTPASLAGDYYEGDGRGSNVQWSIREDGTWEFSSTCCTGLLGADRGKWKETDGKVELEVLESDKSTGEWSTPSDWQPAAGRRSLRFVQWGNRAYLLRADRWLDFVNDINQGFEPRSGIHGHFPLREGDESVPVDGPPTIPDEWRPWLLATPLSGHILEVLNDGDAVASLGERDGVRKGMLFTTRSANGRSGMRIQSRVVSVHSDRCVVRHEYDFMQRAFEEGMEITSRFFEKKP